MGDNIEFQKEIKEAKKRKRAYVTFMVFAGAILILLAAITITSCGKKDSFKSDLTGEGIAGTVSGQRPVAILTDRELKEADIMYAFPGNQYLAVIKDWGKLKDTPCIEGGMGNARQIAPEWNAILVAGKEGISLPYLDVMEADSANGEGISAYLEEKGMSGEYTGYRPEGRHFGFDGTLPVAEGIVPCTKIKAGSAEFTYDEKTKEYKTGEGFSYRNLIFQEAVYLGMKEEPYFNLCDMNHNGWLLRDGNALPLTWTKLNDLENTDFYDLDGNRAVLAPGKTYIGIIGTSDWENISME